MRAAIVYDRVNKWGGAERVLLALHELFPEAPFYTSVYNPETASWAKVFPKIYTSFLQKWKWARTHHEVLALLMPTVFESFNFDSYDLVVSVTSEAAKGIITGTKTKHICYCLTPTRYLWSGYESYFNNFLLRYLLFPVVWYLKTWDKVAAQRPDVMIGISEEVVGRIKKYYAREAKVVYPPVGLDHLGGVMASQAQPATIRGVPYKPTPGVPKLDYFLVVSRLVPYKRVDLVVEAFNKLGLPLIIVGIGSEEKHLKRMAKRNIQFVGNLTDRELALYYREANVLIFPQEEDFGIVAVEAQLMGTPVIAYRDGGALETVIEGKTGEFFNPQTPEALIRVVQKFNKAKYNPKVLRKHGLSFSKTKFKKMFMRLIAKVSTVNTPRV